ncbi:hypothetical protein LX36DRAFT_27116 [Colletotrichum falcatum]|nr:hypothetical protein LX36DRAFT_27116 [Colletotrichum falcatum]
MTEQLGDVTSPTATAMEYRPKGIHTKHLTEADRIRIRTLYFDAYMPPKAIVKQTGYTFSQVRNAIRADSAAVKPRSGRPRRAKKDQVKDQVKGRKKDREKDQEKDQEIDQEKSEEKGQEMDQEMDQKEAGSK